jgi:hypothetical protein
MIWNQLRELKTIGLFDFESHTYWHPNFKGARQAATPDYETGRDSAWKSKEVLETDETPVKMLAWPFGIYDPLLEAKASGGGIFSGIFHRPHRVFGEKDVIPVTRGNADREG